jgi:hypothetical protein
MSHIPVPTGYLLFRSKTAPVVKTPTGFMAQLGESLVAIRTQSGAPIESLTARPVTVEVAGRTFNAELVSKNPILESISYKTETVVEDGKTYKVVK